MKAIEILNKLVKAEHWEDYYPSKNQYEINQEKERAYFDRVEEMRR